MVVVAAKQIQNQNEVEVAPAISAAISRFLDFLTVERGLSRNTLEAYRRDLLRYSRFLAQTGVQDPTNVPEALVSKFVGHLSATPFAEGRRYSASSVARVLAAVRMFHLFLVREGETDANAAQGVVRPKVPRTLPRPLSIGDVTAILKGCGEGDPGSLRDLGEAGVNAARARANRAHS